MWIEDTEGNLHNVQHLTHIYILPNAVMRVWFLKGRDINSTDIVFGAYADYRDAVAAREALAKQLLRRKDAKT
jgi:hypothetical protein